MPTYKAVDVDSLDAQLTAIANAIRAKTGGTDEIMLDEMPTKIASISGSGNINVTVLDSNSMTAEARTTATLAVKILLAQDADVSITCSSSDITISPSTLSFRNGETEKQISITIPASVTGEEYLYFELGTYTKKFVLYISEPGQIGISESSISIATCGNKSFNVSFTSDTDATVSLSCTNSSVAIFPKQLTFESGGTMVKSATVYSLTSTLDDIDTNIKVSCDGYDDKTISLHIDGPERESTISAEKPNLTIRLDPPDSYPEVTPVGKLVPTWSFGSTSFTIGTNSNKESILLTKSKSHIRAYDLNKNSSAAAAFDTWFNSVGVDTYYLPTFPEGCKSIKLTFDEGFMESNARDPKIIFLQGNSTKALQPQGTSKTPSDVDFGERFIRTTVTATDGSQIANGSVIDFAPYWDDSYTYHAFCVRAITANTDLTTIVGCTIEYIDTEGETSIVVPFETMENTFLGRYVSGSQGILAYEDTNELYQFSDGGGCNVLNLTPSTGETDADKSYTKLRYFKINTLNDGAGHFSSVEWYDKANKLMLSTCCAGANTEAANKIYIHDLTDESNVTQVTLTCPELSSLNYSYMSDLAYDSTNKLLYTAGYTPNGSVRTYLIVSKIDMSPYVDRGETTVHVVEEPFITEIYHLQDGAFHNGKLYYLIDNNTTGKGQYNTFKTIVIDPTLKKIVHLYDIPLEDFFVRDGFSRVYKEAEGFCIVNDADGAYLLMNYSGDGGSYYYKVPVL